MRELFAVAFLHLVPVHDIPEILQVLRTGIPVVDVVGMFPYVAGEEWGVFGRERSRGIGGRNDIEGTVGVFHEPCPSGSEGLEGDLVEGFLERFERLPAFEDEGFDIAPFERGLSRDEALPVERMVPDLRSIVENSPCGCGPYDFFEGLSLELGPGNEIVEIVDIGLVVLSVVVFEGFSGEIGFERIERIGKGRKCVSHKIRF